MLLRLSTAFFLLLQGFGFAAKAQPKPKPYVTGPAYFDSLKAQPPRLKPTGDFDQRFSFLGNKNVNIWGYRIGILVNDRYKVGIGAYTLNADFDSTYRQTRGLVEATGVSQKLTFGTVYLEPYLIRRRRWELSMLFELGYGTAIIDSLTLVHRSNGTTSPLVTQGREPFVPMGWGLSFNYIVPDLRGLHFLTYFGLNAIVGMRRVILESDFQANYNGFFYSIGTAIYIDRIFTDITRKKTKKPGQTVPGP